MGLFAALIWPHANSRVVCYLFSDGFPLIAFLFATVALPLPTYIKIENPRPNEWTRGSRYKLMVGSLFVPNVHSLTSLKLDV